MESLTSIRTLLAYGDAMNTKLFAAADALAPEQLDQPFDMGMGTLRKTLAHIFVGESVWLERWKGNAETKWPPYEIEQSPATMLAAFSPLHQSRDAFLATLTRERLNAGQAYRDSKGSVFRATLHEMILQAIVHSTHHRAQAVNMMRRAGNQMVEIDFMYWRRQSVP